MKGDIEKDNLLVGKIVKELEVFKSKPEKNKPKRYDPPDERDHSRRDECDHSRREERDHSRRDESDHSRRDESDHRRVRAVDHPTRLVSGRRNPGVDWQVMTPEDRHAMESDKRDEVGIKKGNFRIV